MSARPSASEIVVVDWRGHRQPDEPGGFRPGVVVENGALFGGTGYPNLIVVPLSSRPRFAALTTIVEQIPPTPENGADRVSWALAHHVTSVAVSRTRQTGSRITPEQLSAIRGKIALAVDADRQELFARDTQRLDVAQADQRRPSTVICAA